MSNNQISERCRLLYDSTTDLSAFVFDQVLEGDNGGSAQLPWFLVTDKRLERMQEAML